MFKSLNKVIAILGMFAITTISAFAMDTNPPVEPVKNAIETEVIDDVQPPLVGYGYFDFSLDECVFLGTTPPSPDCHQDNNGDICTGNVGTTTQNLYYMSRPNPSSPWVCGQPLRKIIKN